MFVLWTVIAEEMPIKQAKIGLERKSGNDRGKSKKWNLHVLRNWSANGAKNESTNKGGELKWYGPLQWHQSWLVLSDGHYCIYAGISTGLTQIFMLTNYYKWCFRLEKKAIASGFQWKYTHGHISVWCISAHQVDGKVAGGGHLHKMTVTKWAWYVLLIQQGETLLHIFSGLYLVGAKLEARNFFGIYGSQTIF